MLILLGMLLIDLVAGDLPYGAHISTMDFYNPPNGKFYCRNGDGPIPLSQINDDYCDCEVDGSDEPGTSACRNGFFYCENAGHVPKNISSRFVNDGVCDCCDGSDEPEGRAICGNNCVALGEVMNAKIREERKKLEVGLQLKQEWISLRNRRFETLDDDIESLNADLKVSKDLYNVVNANKTELEQLVARLKKEHAVDDKESKDDQAEDLEKSASESLFERLDSDKDGVLTIKELDGVFDALIEDHDKSNMINEIVGEEGLLFEDFYAKLYFLVKDLFESESSEDKIEEHVVATTLEYDPETRAAMDNLSVVEQEVREARMKMDSISDQLRKLKKIKTTDFGPKGEFFVLYDKLFEFRDSDYVYGIRLFDRITQSGSGGGEVLIGEFHEWIDSHSGVSYTRGAMCPNGNSRKANLWLKCGIENKVVAVSEPERCVYEIEFESPAACDENKPVTDGIEHDEL